MTEGEPRSCEAAAQDAHLNAGTSLAQDSYWHREEERGEKCENRNIEISIILQSIREKGIRNSQGLSCNQQSWQVRPRADAVGRGTAPAGERSQ